jgi:uncharacterized protein YlbG (UPF0298 family)
MTNEEKIEILINRLDTLEFIKDSFINHAEEFKNKYSLDEVLLDCNTKKTILLQELGNLGRSWPTP